MSSLHGENIPMHKPNFPACNSQPNSQQNAQLNTPLLISSEIMHKPNCPVSKRTENHAQFKQPFKLNLKSCSQFKHITEIMLK